MSAGSGISSNLQLVRFLQIGVVLEEVVEVRAIQHYQSLSPAEQAELDPAIQELLTEARQESAEHRKRLEKFIERLDAETVPTDHVEQLVYDRYGQTKPEDFDDILYDQLHAEESAFKFYDDLITAIQQSGVTFEIDQEELLTTLADIRQEEAEGVEEVIALMEALS